MDMLTDDQDYAPDGKDRANHNVQIERLLAYEEPDQEESYQRIGAVQRYHDRDVAGAQPFPIKVASQGAANSTRGDIESLAQCHLSDDPWHTEGTQHHIVRRNGEAVCQQRSQNRWCAKCGT